MTGKLRRVIRSERVTGAMSEPFDLIPGRHGSGKRHASARSLKLKTPPKWHQSSSTGTVTSQGLDALDLWGI